MFSSLQSTRPVPCSEIAPGKTNAAQSRCTGGQRFDFVQLLVRQVGGNRDGYTVFILVVIGNKTLRLIKISPKAVVRAIRVANGGGTFRFLPINKLFKHHFVIFPQGSCQWRCSALHGCGPWWYPLEPTLAGLTKIG